MWNPFGRSDSAPTTTDTPHAHVADGSAVDGASTCDRTSAAIAEIQVMGNVAVATFTITELSQDQGAEQLADLLHDLAETSAGNYVLDVQNVQFMDTTCLGCLVEALNRLAGTGGQIALASPNHNVHYVFRLTRLDRVFRICADVMTAIEALEGSRKAE